MKFGKKTHGQLVRSKAIGFLAAVKTVLSSVFGNFGRQEGLQAALDKETKF